MNQELMTAKDVAKVLGCSEGNVYALTNTVHNSVQKTFNISRNPFD